MYSQVIYGSYARKDNDSLSDKDIGIFHDNTSDLSEVQKKWTNEGWSCVLYPYEKFSKMANLGLLFVQHIKQDGVILSDNDCKLKNILQSFSPKNTYKSEIIDAMKLSILTNYIPTNINCILWALDITAIVARNFCIAYFANKGVFEFSTYKLYELLANHFNLSRENLSVLMELRRAKYDYRHNSYKEDDLYNYVRILHDANAVLKKVGFNKNISIVSENDFIRSACILITNATIPVYYKIRIAEIIFCLKNKELSDSFKSKYSCLVKSSHSDPYTLSSAQVFENYFADLIKEIFLNKKSCQSFSQYV